MSRSVLSWGKLRDWSSTATFKLIGMHASTYGHISMHLLGAVSSEGVRIYSLMEARQSGSMSHVDITFSGLGPGLWKKFSSQVTKGVGIIVPFVLFHIHIRLFETLGGLQEWYKGTQKGTSRVRARVQTNLVFQDYVYSTHQYSVCYDKCVVIL